MSLSLEDLRDKLSLLLLTQSPHLPTNVTEIKLTDGYRTVELHGINQAEVNDLTGDILELERINSRKESAIDDLHDDNRILEEKLHGAQEEILRLQQDIIDLGMQLNSVLSR